MKKLMFVFLALFVLGCSPSVQYVPGPKGNDGAPGADGSTGPQGPAGLNGHSLVSEYREASWCECDEQGGQALDIYLDLDDTLNLSENDLYSNSLVACNGYNGLNGQNGLNGADGAQGIPGATGPAGADGAIGPTGPAGSNGSAGPVGPPGAIGPTGPQGPAGSGAQVTALTASSCTLVVGSNGYYVKSGSLYDSAGCNSDDKVSLQTGESVWVATLMLVQKDSSGLRSIKFN